MYDYNLAIDDKDKQLIMDDYRETLIDTGVNDRGLEMSYRPANEDIPTCYIVSAYNTGGISVYEFHTIYAGKEWTYFMSSPKALTAGDCMILEELVRKVEYDYEVDYTHTRVVIRQNTQVEEANETTIYIDSKDGRIIFLVTTITVAFLIIYIISERQKKKL